MATREGIKPFVWPVVATILIAAISWAFGIDSRLAKIEERSTVIERLDSKLTSIDQRLSRIEGTLKSPVH